MAVTSWQLHWNGSTGDTDINGGRYAAVYKASTDSHLDNAKTLVDYVLGTAGFSFDDTYEYGNDTDTDSFLTRIAPSKVAGSSTLWDVVLNYEPAADSGQSNPNSDGDQETDPSQWVESFDTKPVSFTVPVERAIYRGGMKGVSARKLRPGKEIIPVNSAFIPFVPGIEMEIFGMSITRGFYRANYNAILPFQALQNHINSNVWPAFANNGFSKLFSAYTVRLVGTESSYEFINNGFWWKHGIELVWNPLGWRKDICDRGRYRRFSPGDPGVSPSDFRRGDPELMVITDSNGNPIDDDVRLDGNGQPLEAGGDTVWLTYSVYQESQFTNAILGL